MKRSLNNLYNWFHAIPCS